MKMQQRPYYVVVVKKENLYEGVGNLGNTGLSKVYLSKSCRDVTAKPLFTNDISQAIKFFSESEASCEALELLVSFPGATNLDEVNVRKIMPEE